MDKIKLPRLYNGKAYYTTGEDQHWTYEYTYEDWEAAERLYPTAPKGSEESDLKLSIIKWFYDHPEIAKKNGIDLYDNSSLI